MGDPRRGRHRKRRSPETIAWEQEHLIPERPSWLDAATYHELVRLRNQAELELGIRPSSSPATLDAG